MTTYRLDGQHVTLLLQQDGEAMPSIVHWGAKLPPDVDADPLRTPAVPQNWLDQVVPLASLWPTVGAGLFQAPAFASHAESAGWARSLSPSRIFTGADNAAFLCSDGDRGGTLIVWLHMRMLGETVTMRTESNDSLPRSDISFQAAGIFVTPAWATELLTFGGRWAGEFQEYRITLQSGAHVVENRRGRTSHDRFPLLVAGTHGFGEERGEVWGVHLGWSGNHRTVAERLPDGSLQIMTGELLEPGEGLRASDKPFVSPTAYGAFSSSGLAGLSRVFHDAVRRVITWPGGAMTPRPVTLNTWEGTYFDHDESRLMQQATAAAALGVERFVLDDGWQKGRTSDRAGLGDWIHDPAKYPKGLGPLAHHVTSLGMQFGLWVEPEMVNPDSDAVRAGAAVLRAGRPQRTARNQIVRDLTHPHEWETVRAALDRLLRSLPIAYLKWDMNRDLTEAGGQDGKPAARAQTLATYALMDRLRADHPDLEIESCASGGGRADLGVLARTHRIWTSDNTDALDRLRIQRGALRLLPPELLGAHVSASPNHQTGRHHTLAFRAAAALFCHFGVELDPLELTEAERTELAAWIALHKRLRPLLHAGLHQATDPVDGRHVLGVMRPDHAEAAYLVTQEDSPHCVMPPPLRLPGLDPQTRYRVTAPPPQVAPDRVSPTHEQLFQDGIVLAGGVLHHVGFVPPPMAPASALVLHVTKEL